MNGPRNHTENEIRRLLASGEVRRAGELLADEPGSLQEKIVRARALAAGMEPPASAAADHDRTPCDPARPLPLSPALTLWAVWLVLWGAAAVFVIMLYRDGQRFPAEAVGPARMRDAWLAIGVIVSVNFLLSAGWLVIWKFWQKVQMDFVSRQRAEGRATRHSALDYSLPLDLRGHSLFINRGFYIQELDAEKLAWIHRYEPPLKHSFSSRGGLMVVFHDRDGRKTRALFAPGDIGGVLAVIGQIRNFNPSLMVSEGLWSAAYQACKRQYERQRRSSVNRTERPYFSASAASGSFWRGSVKKTT